MPKIPNDLRFDDWIILVPNRSLKDRSVIPDLIRDLTKSAQDVRC